jgi:4-hydroxy 2-oxovalerate aldolase
MGWRLIDCTLRDGGNLNNWHYPPAFIDRVLRLLDDGGVDVIEVGYRGGSGSNKAADVGAAARCDPEFLLGLPRLRHAQLAVMCVPTVCPMQSLDDLPALGVGLVRVATYPADAARALPYATALRSLGLRCSFNLMAASYLEPDAIARLAERAERAGADIFYMADTFGGMNPDQVKARISAVRVATEIPVGFHGHNNLGLAFANALAALEAGAEYLDGSLRGLARGAGNLPLEQLVAATETWARLGRRRNTDAVLEAAEVTADTVLRECAPMQVSTAELETGLGNVHYYYHRLIKERSEVSGVSRRAIAQALGVLRPARVDMRFVDQALLSVAPPTESSNDQQPPARS